MTRATLLMCPPRHFNVDYEINPWMRGHMHDVDTARAAEQWQGLRDTLARIADVKLVDAQSGLPDMVFTANAGVVIGRTAIPSNFAHRERQGERAHFARWFRDAGFDVLDMPDQGDDAIAFEGAGDALYATDAPVLYVAHGFRTDKRAVDWLRMHVSDVEIVGLQLADPRYYHLDTCFCPLDGGRLLWNPNAFAPDSRALVHARIGASKRIEVSAADAAAFACNAVNVDEVVVLNSANAPLRAALRSHGFHAVETPLSEFMKSGGAAKCLTLRLDAHFAPWAKSTWANDVVARAA